MRMIEARFVRSLVASNPLDETNGMNLDESIVTGGRNGMRPLRNHSFIRRKKVFAPVAG